ncbi:hypothetical protein GCM10007160_37840 [Litchfieldella qijiaojingensis]|uniref:Uncharacterized protein n=1 Tax=Litchfieldella qijiaojingensis TaxID=980347 RepID=A0ABQ2Z759_9GAMM|nr:hypothetical protein [Halomonas qijiaojingensis]GGY06844.1 hypothetical protein GCM10007160_37840 [Halomonas qijiaojingensis]
MRTLIFIVIGLAILGAVLVVSRPRWRAHVALGFIAVWLTVSAVNLGMGLAAGYALAEELLVHLFLFGVPALAAVWAWRKYRALRS